MKKLITLLGIGTILIGSLTSNSFAFAEKISGNNNIIGAADKSTEIMLVDQTPKITVILDGNVIDFKDQEPVIIEGRTLVPFRAILEAMGAKVEWDDVNRTVRGFKDGMGMVLQIGNKVALVGQQKMDLEVPAQIINDRTMIPLRFVSEGLGYKVDFDNSNMNNYKITISKVEDSKNDNKDLVKSTNEIVKTYE